VHTVFLFNLWFDLPIEELRAFVQSFGEVSSVSPRLSRGMAFVTYFDIRDAQRAVAEAYGKSLAGRMVKASYAFRPPVYSGRDPTEFCSTIVVRAKEHGLEIADVAAFMQQFGEIRASGPGSQADEFVVSFFNLKAARAALDRKTAEIKNITVNFELKPEDDAGEDPTSFQANRRARLPDRPQLLPPPLPPYPPGPYVPYGYPATAPPYANQPFTGYVAQPPPPPPFPAAGFPPNYGLFPLGLPPGDPKDLEKLQ
jgi:RNA recognition motif-containing protein